MEYCTGGKEPEKGSKEKMKENSAAEKILTQSCAVLLEWEKEFVTLDESLEQLRKKNFPYRSPVASLLFEYFRHKTFVDGLIRTFARKGVKQEVRILLACAISSCIFQNGIAPESCANVAVELAKKRFGKGCGNFVNALLHSVLRSETLHNIPSSCFPEDLKKHFIAQFGEEQTEKILQVCGERDIPVTFRSRKDIPENSCVYERLPALDFMKEMPFYRVVDPKAFFNLDLLKDGDVYVQDPATMLALSLLEGPPSGQVLDVCAAPGGKSILLWDLARKGNSKITLHVCDRSPVRLKTLKENLERYQIPAQSFAVSAQKNTFRENSFDLILADVPCGNSGVIRRRCDVPYRYSPKRLRDTSALQKEILHALAPLTAPGGYLLYSTCSIEKIEDEEQIQSFLKEHKEYTLVRQRKLFPCNEYDGAFGALLQKER